MPILEPLFNHWGGAPFITPCTDVRQSWGTKTLPIKMSESRLGFDPKPKHYRGTAGTCLSTITPIEGRVPSSMLSYIMMQLLAASVHCIASLSRCVLSPSVT